MNPFIPGGSYQKKCSAISISVETTLAGASNPTTIQYTTQESESFADISNESGSIVKDPGPYSPSNPPAQPNAPFVPAGSYQLSSGPLTITISATLNDGRSVSLTYGSDDARFFQDIEISEGDDLHCVVWPAPQFVPQGQFSATCQVETVTINATCQTSIDADYRASLPCPYTPHDVSGAGSGADLSSQFKHDIQNSDGSLGLVSDSISTPAPIPPVNFFGPFIPAGSYQATSHGISVTVSARGPDRVLQQVTYEAQRAPLIADIVFEDNKLSVQEKSLSDLASNCTNLGEGAFNNIYSCGYRLYATDGTNVSVYDDFHGRWTVVAKDDGAGVRYFPNYTWLCKLDSAGVISTLDPVSGQWSKIPNNAGMVTTSVFAAGGDLCALQLAPGASNAGLYRYDSDDGKWELICVQDESRWSFAIAVNRVCALSMDAQHVQVAEGSEAPVTWVSLPNCVFGNDTFDSLHVSSDTLYAIEHENRVVWAYNTLLGRWIAIGGDATACTAHPLSPELYKLSSNNLVTTYVGGADPWSILGAGQAPTSLHAGIGVLCQLDSTRRAQAFAPAAYFDKRDVTYDSFFDWFIGVKTGDETVSGKSPRGEGSFTAVSPNDDWSAFLSPDSDFPPLPVPMKPNEWTAKARMILPDLDLDRLAFGYIQRDAATGTFDKLAFWCPESGKEYSLPKWTIDASAIPHGFVIRDVSNPSVVSLEGAEYKLMLDVGYFKTRGVANAESDLWKAICGGGPAAKVSKTKDRIVTFFDTPERSFRGDDYILRVRSDKKRKYWSVMLKRRGHDWRPVYAANGSSSDAKFEADVTPDASSMLGNSTVFSKSWTVDTSVSVGEDADVAKTATKAVNDQPQSFYPPELQPAAPNLYVLQMIHETVKDATISVPMGKSTVALSFSLTYWYLFNSSDPSVPDVVEISFRTNASVGQNWLRMADIYFLKLKGLIQDPNSKEQTFTILSKTKTQWVYEHAFRPPA